MNPPTDPDTLFAALRAADPDVMDRDDLAVLTGQITQLTAWCDALQVRATRRQRALAAEGRAEAPRDLISRHGGQSSKDAKATEDREQICTAMPDFETALTNGAVSAGHVDAIACATRNLDDETLAEFIACQNDLLNDAGNMSVDAFARNARDLAKQLAATAAAGDSDADELERQRKRSKVSRWVDKTTGMHHTHLELDPVRDAALWAAVNATRATLRQQDGNRRTPFDQLQVDAFVTTAGGTGEARVPEVTALIDWQSLCSGAHSRGICETDNGVSLPVSAVRRMCCEADIIPAVLGGDGEVTDLGRSARVANRAQRRALRAMHRTCVHPECTVGFDACRIHHVVAWFFGGPTDLENLVPVCEQHHHLVHEGGWSLTMTHDRVVTWTRPDGIHYHTGSSIDRATGGLARSEPTSPERELTLT